MHAVPQVFLSDNVRRVGMKRWGYGRWELCNPEEEEEEEAQEEAQEVGGEGRWMLWETQEITREGRWKHSIIKRFKRWRKEEEDGGTSTNEAHEEEDEEEGTASSSRGGGTAGAQHTGGASPEQSPSGLQQLL